MLKVLIHAPQADAHALLYLRNLVEALLPLPVQIAAAVHRDAPASVDFQQAIAAFENRIEIDAILETDAGASALGASAQRQREFTAAVDRHAPHHVYVITGDALASLLGVARRFGNSHAFPSAEIILHDSAWAYQSRLSKAHLVAHAQLHGLFAAPWSRVHWLDPRAYEKAGAMFPKHASRINLLPEPVPALPRIDQRDARKHLQIPDEGNYIGCIGTLSEQEGVDQFIHAFARNPHRDEHLLLVGRPTPIVQAAANAYPFLQKQKQILIVDESITDDVQAATMRAVNVVAIPHPHCPRVEGTLLRAISLGRPVLGSTFGWLGTTIDQFKLGWTCPTVDAVATVKCIRNAFTQYDKWKPSTASKRLLQFHSESHFRSAITAMLRDRLNEPTPAAPITWDKVASTQAHTEQ